MIELAAEVASTPVPLHRRTSALQHVPRVPPHRRTSARQHFSSAELRMLGGVLGFLAGLAALGPIAALAAAFLGAVAARVAESR